MTNLIKKCMIYEKYIYYILGDYYDMMREREGGNCIENGFQHDLVI